MDMLVRLYDLPDITPSLAEMEKQGICISRAMAPDMYTILPWIEQHSTVSAKGEATVCFSRAPISLFLATRGKDILGYACYNATALDFFGPTKVLESEQHKGIGKALLLSCLKALGDEGYAYAIIGSVGPVKFYEKCVAAVSIEGSTPGIYRDFIRGRK
ncbi:MAG: GNAT family N-acetyltransferase [Spirochaetia bacterium]|jgi:GNAT superfamily N-acetyltransferase|nr:GNAT family N-acetyltransferase [Spirochaetia bacterium]